MMLVLIGCKTVKPIAPPVVYNEVQYQPRLSSIAVPVDIPAAKITDKVNASLGGVLYEDNSYDNNDGDNLLVKVTKSRNIEFSAEGDIFSYSVPLKIWVKTKVGILGMDSYHEADLGILLKFKSKVVVQNNWKLQSTTTLEGYDWLSEPVIKVAGSLDIPVRFMADYILEKQKVRLTTIIDQSVSQFLNIKPYVEGAWVQLQNSIEVSKDPAAWVKIMPVEVSMTPLIANAGKIRSFIGMKAYIKTVLGTKPAEEKKTILPNLQIVSKTVEDFNVSLEVRTSYTDATEIVKKQLLNQTFEFNDGKKKITVTSVEIYPNGKKLAIKLGFVGSLSGIAYLTCNPYYEKSTQNVMVKNLDYDLDTKNKLAKSASWMFYDIFIRKIQKSCVFPLKEQFAEAQRQAKTNLSNNEVAKGIKLNGELTSIEPQEIVLTEEAISALIDLKGKLSVSVDGLDF